MSSRAAKKKDARFERLLMSTSAATLDSVALINLLLDKGIITQEELIDKKRTLIESIVKKEQT